MHSAQKRATHLIATSPEATFGTVLGDGKAFPRPRRVPGGMLIAPHEVRAGYPAAVAAVLLQI